MPRADEALARALKRAEDALDMEAARYLSETSPNIDATASPRGFANAVAAGFCMFAAAVVSVAAEAVADLEGGDDASADR
jgi:hypothetical protein